MKKIYVSPLTEKITEAWAKCDTDLYASHVHAGEDSQTVGKWTDEDEEKDPFVVGAKKFIWDDEDSPWNNY